MQFEPEFRFDMDDSFTGMCGPCPSTTASFSSAPSSAYDPFTPSSRRSTPNELSFDSIEGGYSAHQPLDMTPPSAKYFMTTPVKHEQEHGHQHQHRHQHQHQHHFGGSLSGSLPTTPMKRIDSFSTEYDLLDINMGTMTPSNNHGSGGAVNGSFHIHHDGTISPEAAMGPSSYMMTPTQSLSGSDVADSSSSWSVPNESPVHPYFQPRDGLVSFNDIESLDLDRHSLSPMYHPGHYHPGPPPTPSNARRVERKMMLHEAQRKTGELQRAQQIRASRKVSAGDGPSCEPVESSNGSVDVVRRAMCKCDYPGCHKAFRRNEHLKRHKQTFHGEGPNRFSCEFCGKDQFNRQDNLNNHRKLHARPNSRNRGVEFIPAAVPIIDQEERSRKRRAPPKSKAGHKSEYDY
ncbi:ZnF C2H2 [Geosmithia morbida]|uniref:ZnF C2H2 n=1 Tax=Geosmithia morbida TaxID=1094350 RepID=A0A9P4YS04_9HYPO|nr:ZnF C2H2 [Geosmithia morbida]KAF4121680.1 ZnF C2H2 [Geosmithia morbida]